MEAVELARRLAADLHARGVEAGSDPWSPYAFALAEAERRDIDVEEAAVGAAELRGGRASFDPYDRLILIEDAGGPFDRAFLVAHEIGHLVLGDAGTGTAGTIDPTRAAEAPPLGFDRVVDYGRRQRREVQVDLFAREFLLPRAVLAAMHVGEGMDASAIARRTGAPFAVVAQQLLDALLLPRFDPVEERVKPAPPLNDEQRAAVEHRGAAYLLEAGPGTGKTRTLVARVESLLDEGVDPTTILLLTFSNKAAGEMSDRIASTRPAEAAAMTITTFHAFGLDLVRRFHGEMGMPEEPRMMDRTEAVELFEEAFPSLGLVHHRDIYDPTAIIADMLAAVSRAKDEVVGPQAYELLAQAMAEEARRGADAGEHGEAPDRAATRAAEALEVAAFYAAYEASKAQARAIDFGDLVMRPVELLEGNEAVRTVLRARYAHVLVDEYQDVNRASVRLLKALTGKGANLWAVGDARQSIYRFRGASSFNTGSFRDDFADAARGRLEVNYRSVGEVVDAFGAFAADMRAGCGNAGQEADRGPRGHAPLIQTADGSGQEIVVLADAIRAMEAAGHGLRDQAVLSTGNEKLARLGRGLESLGIPVLHLGSLFERPEVKDLLALLSLLVDGRAAGLLRTSRLPGFEMPLRDVAAIIDHLAASDGPVGDWAGIAATAALSEEGRKAVEAVRDALESFDARSAPWDVLTCVLLDRTRMAAEFAGTRDAAAGARGIAIWQLMNFLRSQPAAGRGAPVARLLQRIRRLLRLGDDRDLRELPAAARSLDAVRLMTIHGAKGLEFEVVHIPGLNADTMPLRTPPHPRCPPPDGMVEGAPASGEALAMAHREDQECLFYVALSRARDRLLLYAPTRTKSGSSRPLSGFLDRLGPGVARVHLDPGRSAPVPPQDSPVDLSIEGTLRFEAAQVELYETCPRRFLYTHVLRIGGRRSSSAFMAMHEATRTVVEGMVRDGASDGAELERRVAAALDRQGLSGHGYIDDYRALALAMVRFFSDIRSGLHPEPPTALTIAYPDAEVTVRADDVLVRPDGSRVLRRVRTGHMRSAEAKDVGAAAFLTAARQAFPGAAVELVHLADETLTTVQLSARESSGRRAKLAGFLERIRGGEFPTDASQRRCPSCPAFFVCGPAPPGRLVRTFATR